MDRWTGILKVALNPSNSAPHFKVAASFLLSPASKTLAVPSMNAIFFKGDRVQGTGNQAIDRLSESENIAEILVSKLGDSVNAWVVEASTFHGPFAVFKEFVPTVNSRGEPKHYDPDGFPASSSIVRIISKSIDQVRSTVSVYKNGSPIPEMRTPKTALFGFSKGGTVINQIVAELANKNVMDAVTVTTTSDSQTVQTRNSIFPASKDSFLRSIFEFHYVDVGLNCRGAYLTDRAAVDQVARDLMIYNSSLRFVLHGTPRQWCDLNRPWIREEKDSLFRLLRDAGEKYGGRLQASERFYFADAQPTLQMHFEIIDSMDVG
ncbi:hypothetical protein KSP40_PGU005771 [Platanthera guangdongensis]|uniref:DUF2235 domain-containing protein n=1 Tax=Platanthera guangdongensis TaxID=2320717 RepID=A0ABR2LNI6_9ASPA